LAVLRREIAVLPNDIGGLGGTLEHEFVSAEGQLRGVVVVQGSLESFFTFKSGENRYRGLKKI